MASYSSSALIKLLQRIRRTKCDRPAVGRARITKRLQERGTSRRQRLKLHGAIDLETGATRMIEKTMVDAASTIGHRIKIIQEIVLEHLDLAVGDVRAVLAYAQCVTVGCCPGNSADADGASCTAKILNGHGLTKRRSHVVGQGACNHVRWTAGSERHNYRNRPRWIFLRPRHARRSRHRRSSCRQNQDSAPSRFRHQPPLSVSNCRTTTPLANRRFHGALPCGFAIPADSVKSIVDQLKEHGSVTRGCGVLVAEPEPNSSAANAGMVSRDVIQSVKLPAAWLRGYMPAGPHRTGRSTGWRRSCVARGREPSGK